MKTENPRIAFFSSGMVGLGHMRRNLLIAHRLAHSRLRSVNFIIAEAREASRFVGALPPRADCVTLPALRKDEHGECQPRYLKVELECLVNLRAGIIQKALEAFDPDLLIADYLPKGAFCELVPALESLRSRGRTRSVLGLRDVLGEPQAIRSEWACQANDEAMRRYYDQVWVYGDRSVYDPVLEYQFPSDIASKIRFTGYLDQTLRLKASAANSDEFLRSLRLPEGKYVLCLVGGGQDGERLANAFVQARFPSHLSGVLVTGPFMSPPARLQLLEAANRRRELRVLDFIAEPGFVVSKAERVICMGGYNSVCEVLSFAKPALVVPRTKPRSEQLIRAQRLHALGLLDLLHPDDLSPSALSDWLHRSGNFPSSRSRVNLRGQKVLPKLVQELLAGLPRDSQCWPHRQRTAAASCRAKPVCLPNEEPMSSMIPAPLDGTAGSPEVGEPLTPSVRMG